MKFSIIAAISAVASAAPILRRDVGTLTFQDAAASDKKINLVTADASIPVGLNNGVLTAEQEPITVDFLPADSQFMKYTNSDDTKYGHIVNTADQQALTVDSPGAAQGQTIYLSESSISEDSSQMLQYWELDVASQEVKFLGAPQGANFGSGPFTPESQNEGNGLEIALNTDTAAKFVLQ